MNVGQYKCETPLSKQLLAVGLAHAPHLSLTAAELLIPCVVASFLTQVGIEIDAKNIAQLCPCRESLSNMLVEAAVKTSIDMKREVQKAKFVSIGTDKGNKKGFSHLGKMIGWWNEELDRVRKWTLDIDSSGNSSADVAESIDASLRKVDSILKRIRVSVFSSDAGGGGTGNRGMSEVINVDCAMENVQELIVVTCAIHAFQLTLSNPMIQCCGEGGLLRRNLLQMLHSAYNLQHQYEEVEWRQKWFLATGQKSKKKMVQPVLTRWEYVGQAATHLYEQWDDWLKVATCILRDEAANSAANQIVSALFSLMQETTLKAQLAFVYAYHCVFFDKNIQWLKHIDGETKEPGFLSHHIAVRYFLMHRDLNNLASMWKNNPQFAPFLEIVSNIDDANLQAVMEERFPSKFFSFALGALKKHFDQWRGINTLPITITGEPETSQAMARWFVGKNGTGVSNNIFI